jgi:hypothetical protein
MKLALKAQSQCRTTVEAISENPQPFSFVRQANIGKPVQVNISTACDLTTATRAEKSENAPNELLEEKPYEPLDTATPSPTGQADPAMATVGKNYRAENG